jgi:hypothetical protein
VEGSVENRSLSAATLGWAQVGTRVKVFAKAVCSSHQNTNLAALPACNKGRWYREGFRREPPAPGRPPGAGAPSVGSETPALSGLRVSGIAAGFFLRPG